LDEGHLRGANLSAANLKNVRLSDADLSGANLRGADLTGSYELSRTHTPTFTDALYDESTKLPPWIILQRADMVKMG